MDKLITVFYKDHAESTLQLKFLCKRILAVYTFCKGICTEQSRGVEKMRKPSWRMFRSKAGADETLCTTRWRSHFLPRAKAVGIGKLLTCGTAYQPGVLKFSTLTLTLVYFNFGLTCGTAHQTGVLKVLDFNLSLTLV